jgi:hypothetical protein
VTFLTATQADIAQSDPAALLQDMKNVRLYDGVPVLILDPATTPKNLEDFKTQTARLLRAYRHWEDGYPNPLQKAKLGLSRYFNRAAERQTGTARLREITTILQTHLHDMLTNNQTRPTMPSVWTHYATQQKLWAHDAGPAAYQPMQCAILIPPHPHFTIDSFLCASSNLIRTHLPPLHDNQSSWHATCLMHEFAHITGAAEPQADKMAILTALRHFPDDIAPYILTDIRAVTALRRAHHLTLLPPEHAKPMLDFLKSYGWPMVQAGDDAARRAAQNPDPRAIMNTRFEKYNHDTGPLLTLGAIATRYPDLVATRLQDFAYGATRLEEEITEHTADPVLHEMAERVAQAARRLANGAAAYKDRARQPFLTPRPA